MASFRHVLDYLDSAPQVRDRHFEDICKWPLRHDPVYRTQLEKVWLWEEWPDREGRDLGIDLVARTKDPELQPSPAIQSPGRFPEVIRPP